MNHYTGVYVGLRALYILLYINTTSLKNAHARSIVWITGLVTLFTLYFKAANKVLADS